jgi:universal stress protein A
LEALLKDLPGDLNKTTLLRSGRPAYEIVEAAKRLDTDLIIISTHGHTGLKHVFLGSTAENVVRYAPCPVLTVREHEHEFVKS